MRPKVVEPVAGDAGAVATRRSPIPASRTSARSRRGPASAGARAAAAPATTDITKATALGNGVALPPLEAPEEVKQIIEAGNIIARTPYVWGGGHGKWLDNGLRLLRLGLVRARRRRPAQRAAGLRAADELGQAGPGKWVTI